MWIRDSGFGIRDSGFGIRDSGFGVVCRTAFCTGSSRRKWCLLLSERIWWRGSYRAEARFSRTRRRRRRT
ncbi:hypothetical protein T484DRAFT_1980361 [Baffinella frigidus]|nr:hypothetical protein T484DRAFT_1980361 [Cryptophyta sp. CCMP2293]